MKYRLLLSYQAGVAASDTLTGIMLLVAPLFTLRMMHIAVADSAVIFVSWIGAFVASVGVACVYGTRLMICNGCTNRLETVWLLTAVTRGMVACFLVVSIMAGLLAPAWLTVAVFDGVCALIQTIGLRREWLKHVVR